MIIGTAGHIDHGKSSLVQALTGRSMDPLPEERQRGITLDLHVVPLSLPDGAVIGVIDVPGHEDLVRTMIAGAAGIDLALLVVAADDGIMPQTREHLTVLEQLGIPAGIPVLTKTDLVEPAWLDLLDAEVREWLASSPVAFTDPVAVSVQAGRGLDRLRAVIEQSCRRLGGRSHDDIVRVPVDRVLSVPGTGTVVTGTVWSGALQLGDPVLLLPSGQEARIRSLQRHGTSVERVAAGDRAALGLAGVEHDGVSRGEVVVAPDDGWATTRTLDVDLELAPHAPRPIVHRTRVRMHLGTCEALARVQTEVVLLPGQTAVARLVLEAPVVARGGDRIVIRSYSPVAVIGGGRVLDPRPPVGRFRGEPQLANAAAGLRLEALVRRRAGALPVTEVPIVLGVAPREVERILANAAVRCWSRFLLSSGTVEQAEDAARAAVAAYHAEHPTDPGMPSETLRSAMTRRGPAGEAAVESLCARGELLVTAGTVAMRDFAPRVAGGEGQVDRLVAAIEAAGLSPPTVVELAQSVGVREAAEALRLAARQGRVVGVERDRYYGRRALDAFTAALAAIAAAGPITPAAVRDAVGVSRKFVIPLLEWADQVGLTVRRGDTTRVAGPGLPVAPPR